MRRLGAVCVLGLLLSWSPGPATAEDTGPFDAMHAGVVAAGEGNHERAVVLFTDALKVEGLPAKTLASIYYRRGLSNQRLGRTGEAIADYTQTLSLKVLKPETRAIIHYNRALAYDTMGEEKRSLADIDAALELRPNFAEAYNNRGNLHRRAGRHQEAISDFETSIALGNPMAHLPLYALGLTFEAMGEKARAFDYFNAAHEANPEFAPAREKAFARGSAVSREADEEVAYYGEGDATPVGERQSPRVEPGYDDATGAIPSARARPAPNVSVSGLAPPGLRPTTDGPDGAALVASASFAGDAIVQLAAFSSPDRVDRGWSELAKRHPELLAGFAPTARELLRPDGPPLYALQIEVEAWDLADGLCTQLKARGETCVVKAAR